MCRRFFRRAGPEEPGPTQARAVIADIGFILHWPLSDLEDCDWRELLDYHRLAMERFQITMKMAGITPQ
jgi:hypothetical protein